MASRFSTMPLADMPSDLLEITRGIEKQTLREKVCNICLNLDKCIHIEKIGPIFFRSICDPALIRWLLERFPTLHDAILCTVAQFSNIDIVRCFIVDVEGRGDILCAALRHASLEPGLLAGRRTRLLSYPPDLSNAPVLDWDAHTMPTDTQQVPPRLDHSAVLQAAMEGGKHIAVRALAADLVRRSETELSVIFPRIALVFARCSGSNIFFCTFVNSLPVRFLEQSVYRRGLFHGMMHTAIVHAAFSLFETMFNSTPVQWLFELTGEETKFRLRCTAFSVAMSRGAVDAARSIANMDIMETRRVCEDLHLNRSMYCPLCSV